MSWKMSVNRLWQRVTFGTVLTRLDAMYSRAAGARKHHRSEILNPGLGVLTPCLSWQDGRGGGRGVAGNVVDWTDRPGRVDLFLVSALRGCDFVQCNARHYLPVGRWPTLNVSAFEVLPKKHALASGRTWRVVVF